MDDTVQIRCHRGKASYRDKARGAERLFPAVHELRNNAVL